MTYINSFEDPEYIYSGFYVFIRGKERARIWKTEKATVYFQRILIWNVDFFPIHLTVLNIKYLGPWYALTVMCVSWVHVAMLKSPVMICLGRTLVALMSWAGTEGSPPRL